ncbi:hypothetical protein VTN49DRAFT_7686 [Thermomyces lanuginosus]|uniref:uncharacterized protein n=1 Tax=Thermomyces lanuginosus TaxID=5541 RepID=UPI003743EF4A
MPTPFPGHRETQQLRIITEDHARRQRSPAASILPCAQLAQVTWCALLNPIPMLSTATTRRLPELIDYGV